MILRTLTLLLFTVSVLLQSFGSCFVPLSRRRHRRRSSSCCSIAVWELRGHKNNGPNSSSSSTSNVDSEDGSLVDPSDIMDSLSSDASDQGRRDMIINAFGVGLILSSAAVAGTQLFRETLYTPPGFRRLPVTQFVAALGDPGASIGIGAEQWGLWSVDPGPRGVWLRDFDEQLVRTNGVAPQGWKFNPNDWWLEEHGLIMESPKFPIKPGRYLVTGYRDVITGLTIESDGSWKLDEGTLYDVTHLPCRAARYSPQAEASENGKGPASALLTDFPVRPGATMPEVPGCNKQDYAVLFLIGQAVAS